MDQEVVIVAKRNGRLAYIPTRVCDKKHTCMHYPVVVRAASEHRYVARPVGLSEIEAETERAAIDAVRQKLETWLGMPSY